jgi:hypothetical protein
MASRSVKMPTMSPLRAFVIMPFDPEFDEVYKHLIAAPLADAGYVVTRADDVEARQNVLADVVRGIADADLVVADVTTANPNVFYELGLAHAMGVPTVLIAQRDAAEEIPFDLRQYRTEFYDTHFQRAKAIADAIGELGRTHAAGEVAFGSPISDFLPGAHRPASHSARTGAVGVLPSGDKKSDSAIAQAGPGAAEPDEDGIIDFVDGVAAAADELEGVMEAISAATNEVGSQVATRTQKMNELDPANPNSQTVGKRSLLGVAKVLEEYAASLEQSQPDLERVVDGVTSNGLGYITLVAGNPEMFGDQLGEALNTSLGLRQAVVDSSQAMLELRDSLAGLPPILKQTNRARNRTVRALDALIAQQERVRSYAEQSIQLAEEGLALRKA